MSKKSKKRAKQNLPAPAPNPKDAKEKNVPRYIDVTEYIDGDIDNEKVRFVVDMNRLADGPYKQAILSALAKKGIHDWYILEDQSLIYSLATFHPAEDAKVLHEEAKDLGLVDGHVFLEIQFPSTKK